MTDFLCTALGYDRYTDLTTEFQVRGEFADYSIRIDQQVVTTLTLEVDLLSDETTSKKVAALFHLHRSALKRSTISDRWRQQVATAPSALAEVLQSPHVLDAIRKEVRRRSGFNPEVKNIEAAIRADVIRPELLLP